MLSSMIAPWILESWHEFFVALSFDVPVLGLPDDKAHIAIAAVAFLLLVFAWRNVAALPGAARTAMRGLLTLVLLAPVAIFVANHTDTVRNVREFVGFETAHRTVEAAQTVAQPAPVPNLPVASAQPPEPARSAQPSSPPEPASAAVAAIEPAPSPVPVATAPAPPVAPAANASAAMKKVAQSLARLVPRLGPDAGTVPVYFGTDRASDPGAAKPDYTAARAVRLELGKAIVTLPKPGATGPTAARFTVSEIASLSRDALLEAVVPRLARARHFPDHALVFVPGFDTSFESALVRTSQIASDLNFDGAAFVYSWPSTGRIAEYAYDRESAGLSAPYLADFLRIVLAQTGAKSIIIMTHGLGTAVTLDTLAALKDEIPAGVTVRELILAAPDMDRSAFKAKVAAVADIARRTTLYVASSDRGLNISRRYTGGVPRAGDVLEGGPLVIPGVETVDVSVTGTDTVALNHPGSVRPGALIADIGGRLLGSDARYSMPAGLESVATPKGPYLRYSPSKTYAR